MARFFLLGKKSSQIINLDYVSRIEIEQAPYLKEHGYMIKFHVTEWANANIDTATVLYEDVFSTEQDARNFLVAALNLNFIAE